MICQICLFVWISVLWDSSFISSGTFSIDLVFLVLGVRILSQNMNKQYLLVLSPRSPDKRFWSLHGFYWLFDWLIDWGFSPNRQDFSHVTTFVDIEMWSVFENSDTSLAIPSKESTLFFEIHRNRLCVPRGLIVILETRTI